MLKVHSIAFWSKSKLRIRCRFYLPCFSVDHHASIIYEITFQNHFSFFGTPPQPNTVSYLYMKDQLSEDYLDNISVLSHIVTVVLERR